jgi:hypothetical protein
MTDDVAASYRRCRELNWAHDRTYCTPSIVAWWAASLSWVAGERATAAVKTGHWRAKVPVGWASWWKAW